MSDAASRMRSAPARARTSGAREVVARSGLPERLGEIVLGVASRCRLWRREREDVAKELCGHFLDGLASGAPADRLAADFGDPAAAAKLITAARKRLRPAWWQVWRMGLRAVGWTTAACLVLYAIMAARYFLASPTIGRNYTRELREAAFANTPESELAWPLYIRAVREFGPLPEFMRSEHPDPRRPDDINFELMTAFLDSHASALATVREAAGRPMIGYPWSDVADPDYSRALEISNPAYRYDPSAQAPTENPLMIGVLLPHLGEMRKLGRWLATDAHLAASRKDSQRFIADIEALAGMADQALREPFIISQMVGVALGQLLCVTVLEEAADPGLLDARGLRTLAHRIAAIGGGRISIESTGEVLMIEDVIQRFYSDDGSGGGRLVGSPMREEMWDSWGAARPRGEFILEALRPVQSAVLMPSRSKIRAEIDRFKAEFARDDQLQPWRAHERTSDGPYSWLMYDVIGSIPPIFSSLQGGDANTGPMTTGLAHRDRFESTRGATLAVLALQSYFVAEGRYPPALESLSPEYLPKVPVDPFDGRPLRYVPASATGGPVLYSIGADATDDGGVLPPTEEGRRRMSDLKLFARARKSGEDGRLAASMLESVDGDWILWPADGNR
ncbi:MAG: hypothetical protein GIKADHBN_00841 [Phycisphaerales bacterium]|nr:hypothetical protein [Phycisphaerales bacterium]